MLTTTFSFARLSVPAICSRVQKPYWPLEQPVHLNFIFEELPGVIFGNITNFLKIIFLGMKMFKNFVSESD
jgi:hypothetical protein